MLFGYLSEYWTQIDIVEIMRITRNNNILGKSSIFCNRIYLSIGFLFTLRNALENAPPGCLVGTDIVVDGPILDGS